jgi:hypothetical protein
MGLWSNAKSAALTIHFTWVLEGMATMSDFDADVFVKAPFIERIALCRRMADLTVEHSRAANPRHRENYLDLAKRWRELAEDMERAQPHKAIGTN